MKRFLRDTELGERFSVSRTTIWRWVKEASFPKPIKVTSGSTRWKIEDVEQWENTKRGNAQ